LKNFVSNPHIDSLADRLRAASSAYYAGKPEMTDAEFDALEESVRSASPDHPVFAEIGAPVSSGWPKVRHPIPMGSLDKAQDDAELLAWATRVGVSKAHPVFVTEKLDGISILLTYNGGNLVRAETRGDGEEGEDITRNVRIMKGVPAHVPYDEECWVRAEIVCNKTDFAVYFQGESNPRNTAAGTAKRQTGWQKAKHLTVYAYNLTAKSPDHGAKTREEEFGALNTWGFLTPAHYLLEDAGQVVTCRQLYIDTKRDSCSYDIDGLVVEVNDTVVRTAFGHHNHRPKGAIAFKFPHEAKRTVIRDIRWQVGASGRVTPVALFDAVDLAGASVKQASLHNVANITRLVRERVGVGAAIFTEGDEIMVSRRNDVIPYVESLLVPATSGKSLVVPSKCPACSGNLQMDGEYLVCVNDATCPAQSIGYLQRWIRKLNILHFGDELLNALWDAEMVRTIGDLYRINPSEAAKLSVDGRRIGRKADRAFANLHAKKGVTIDLFIGSLGIPLVGRKMTKLLVDAGISDLSAMAKATEAQMAAVPGFGSERARSFRTGFDKRRQLIYDILAAGVSIVEPEEPEVTGDAMKDQAICFSGVRDKEAAAAIAAQGGRVASGVSKNTTLLVLKDANSTSSKAQKARTLGIEIIDLPTMRSRLGLS
jgi:DNA ligase (NAD+)